MKGMMTPSARSLSPAAMPLLEALELGGDPGCAPSSLFERDLLGLGGSDGR